VCAHLDAVAAIDAAWAYDNNSGHIKAIIERKQ
jgi:hypothetical protein